MSTLTAERSIAGILLERPARSRIFEALGIDYCCGGKKTLREACGALDLEPSAVIEMLEQADTARMPAHSDALESMTLGELIDDILETHHAHLRRELPRLNVLLAKVARVHGAREPRLEEMLFVFEEFVQELAHHMLKEERILFPAIARMESSGTCGGNCFGSVANPIAQMEAEHGAADTALARLRELSDGFTPPDWACNTFRALLDGLNELEQNMHLHVHKENNVLFPGAIALERRLDGTDTEEGA